MQMRHTRGGGDGGREGGAAVLLGLQFVTLVLHNSLAHAPPEDGFAGNSGPEQGGGMDMARQSLTRVQ